MTLLDQWHEDAFEAGYRLGVDETETATLAKAMTPERAYDAGLFVGALRAEANASWPREQLAAGQALGVKLAGRGIPSKLASGEACVWIAVAFSDHGVSRSEIAKRVCLMKPTMSLPQIDDIRKELIADGHIGTRRAGRHTTYELL
jgi:hypothetical protein